jgi:lysophospholipase L1-like esterase
LNPAVRQLLIGSPQQWRGTLPALRAFVTANYDQPNPHNQAAMASPPTVTANNTTQPAGLTQEVLASAGAPIRFYGGRRKAYSGQLYRVPCVSTIKNVGNSLDNENATHWRVSAVCDAKDVSIKVGGSTASALPYRFIVDGQYVDLTGTLTTTSTGSSHQYFKLAFATKAARTITVENEQSTSFAAFGALPTDTITAPAAPKRMIVLGDSITKGTGTTRIADCFARVAGDMLGIADVWAAGLSGTGYVADDSGTEYKLPQHLQDANLYGPWDVIVIAMGINDKDLSTTSVTNEVAACTTVLRRANPSAQIFVVGPWDNGAPDAPLASHTACKAAIQVGIPAGKGITFLDPTGVTYTKWVTDGTHPDDAGHKTLGDWLALQIKTALGA